MPRTSIEHAVVAGDIGALLAYARKASGIAGKRHARDLLERALLAADPGAVSQEQRDAARRVGVDAHESGAPEIDLPPHAVMVPVVLQPHGIGIVRYMRVAFDASVYGGYQLAFDSAAARAVSDALALAAERLDRAVVDRAYCLTTVHPDAFAVSGAAAQLTGPSLGAATFVSAMSLWSERPIAAGTVVTGKIVGRDVRAVGGLDQKIRAAVSTRSDVVRVIVPRESLAHARRALRFGNRHRGRGSAIELIGVRTVDELVDASLAPIPKRPLSVRHRLGVLRLEFEQGWHGFHWINVREHAERLVSVVPLESAEQRVELLSMLGASHERTGSPLRSLQVLDQALATARTEAGTRWVTDLVLSRLHQRRAMTQRRLFRIADARRSVALAIKHAARGRHADELYKAHGCAGLVELAAGRGRAAVVALQRSLDLTHEHAPDSCLRPHGYLIEAHARAGDAAKSEAEWTEAMDHAQRAALMSLPSTSEAWLRTSRGTALWLLGRSDAAVAVLDVPVVRSVIASAPLPGIWARRVLGLALMKEGRLDEGQSLLAASEFAYGPSIETNLVFGAQINVLCEASALLSHGLWDSDIAGRASRALERFPEHLRIGTMERLRARTAVGLQSPGLPAASTAASLSALLSLATRIA